MQNQIKIAFVFSIGIIVCWLSIPICYAQNIDNSADIKTDHVDKYSSPLSSEQNSDSSYLRSDGEPIEENYTPAPEKRKDQKQNDEVVIDKMRSDGEPIEENYTPAPEKRKDQRQDEDEKIYENYTPAQEKPIIHHNKQEKNKLPASEPNLNKDQTEKAENNSN